MWNAYPEATVVFANRITYPPVNGDEVNKVLERFVIFMYDKSSTATDIDSVGFDLFARKRRAYDAIPTITSAALEYHTKRAAYQVLIPSEWMGLKQQDNSWAIIWASLPPIAESCQQLNKCGCTTSCNDRCKCYRFSLPCAEFSAVTMKDDYQIVVDGILCRIYN